MASCEVQKIIYKIRCNKVKNIVPDRQYNRFYNFCEREGHCRVEIEDWTTATDLILPLQRSNPQFLLYNDLLVQKM